MKIKENVFTVTLGLSALFVASISAFFSVAGIGMLFSGAPMSAMLMASSLEFGKLTATTFLYRYWKKTSNLLRMYLISAVITLMAITSIGVFGWLTSAYQSSSLKYAVVQQKIETLEKQKGQIQSQINTSNTRIDNLNSLRKDQEKRLGEIIGNSVLARNATQFRQVQEQNMKLISDTDANLSNESSKIDKLNQDMSKVDAQIVEMKIGSAETKDVVTFQFVADSIGLDLTSTVKWFILAIIVVFDPLSVCLLLAYNVAKANPLTVSETEDIKKN